MTIPCGGTDLPNLLLPEGSGGFGIGSVSNAVIENLWRAKRHLSTQPMMVVSPLFICTVTAACTRCTTGTRTRLATAMH